MSLSHAAFFLVRVVLFMLAAWQIVSGLRTLRRDLLDERERRSTHRPNRRL